MNIVMTFSFGPPDAPPPADVIVNAVASPSVETLTAQVSALQDQVKSLVASCTVAAVPLTLGMHGVLTKDTSNAALVEQSIPKQLTRQ
eukprot:6548438-Pyramimonas_sp.AAC.1